MNNIPLWIRIKMATWVLFKGYATTYKTREVTAGKRISRGKDYCLAKYSVNVEWVEAKAKEQSDG